MDRKYEQLAIEYFDFCENKLNKILTLDDEMLLLEFTEWLDSRPDLKPCSCPVVDSKSQETSS